MYKRWATFEILNTSFRDIRRAAAIVRGGGVIAFPTDTVYGLGCDPRNPRALGRILSIKGKRSKPFPLLVCSTRRANSIAVMDEPARILASRFWPGALTMVLKPRVRFPALLTMGRKTVAVRCPKNKATLQIIKRCGGLLLGTSANLTGELACRNARMVRRFLGNRIDALVDGGSSPRRTGSTIVCVYKRRVRILRKGPVSTKEIQRTLLRPVCGQRGKSRQQSRSGKRFFKH